MTDFLDLCEHVRCVEVMEDDLYKIIEEAHTLIKTKNKNSVPNTLRKFYECILYKCKKENSNKIVYKKKFDRSFIDVSETTKKIFEKEQDFYRSVINPFLAFVNNASHCQDANYATIKKSEINKCIEQTIQIWNWYAKRIRNLDDKYLINAKKFDLPDVLDFDIFEAKLQSKNNEIQKLRAQLALTLSEIKEAEEEKAAEKDTEEDEPLDITELEQDILQTINEFIADNIYCTHRTIALFLLGDKIPQTEFKKLTERELFAKYAKKKFTVFEYDLALQQLINEEKIILVDAYYHPFDKTMTVFDKWLINLKTKIYSLTSRLGNYKTKINRRDIDIIMEAIDKKKKIKLKYYKTIANTNKKEVSSRILEPVLMIPKEKKDEPFDINNIPKYPPETLFYLKAYEEGAEKSEKPKTFRLDNIKNPKIIK